MKKLLLFLFLLSSPVLGATYYVDGDLGSNCTSSDYSIANRACDGSDGDAYTTVDGAVRAPLVAGDTILIRAGTYTTERMDINGDSCASTMTTTLQNYNSESVTIQADLWDTDIFVLGSTCDNLTFSGLIFIGVRPVTEELFDDFSGTALRSSAGEEATGRLTVENCTFSEFAHTAMKGTAFHWTIKNNYFFNIGGNQTDGYGDPQDHAIYLGNVGVAGDESIVEYNRFGANIGGAAIHAYIQPEYWIIRYNVIEGGSANLWGILLACGFCQVYGNTITGNSTGILMFRDTSHDNIVKNNIFDNNRACDLGTDTAGDIFFPVNNTVLNNYYGSGFTCPDDDGDHSGDGGDDYTAYNDSPNIQNTDNPFVESSPATWFDFRLNAGSLAIDAGETLTEDTGEPFSENFDDALDPNGSAIPPSTVSVFDQGSVWEMGSFVYNGVLLTGTLADGATEAEIVSGGQIIIATLSVDTWVTAGATFNAQRQNIIDGLDSAQSEAAGWNVEVRDNSSTLPVTAVVRTSNTIVTITLSAAASYNITSNENITFTVPASAITISSSDLIATPAVVTVVVSANSLTMQFTGVVTDIKDAGGHLPAAIEVGDAVTGSFFYTTTATDRDADSTIGDYRFHSAPDTLTFTVEGNTWQPATRFTLLALTRNLASEDTLTVSLRGINFPVDAAFNGDPTNSNHSFMQFSLVDPDASVLTDDSLPTGLTLANWPVGIIEMLATYDTSTGDYYRILVETVTTLVEP